MRVLPIQIVFILFLVTRLNSQIQFTNRNDLLHEKDAHSAVPVGIADMNGDGLEDIVGVDLGRNLFIQYQTPDPARPFVRYEVPVFLDNNEQNDICIADVNNDGFNDIITVGSYDRVKVLYNVPHTYQFNLTYVVVTPFFSQGASTGDFNHDGWVDLVVLNDNGLNYTLLNDGYGTLVEQTLFDFVTVPPSDNSGNYGSLYTDFDMDGDLDFYIAKCRQNVTNSTDPRRIDVLFVNDGSGNYTESAAAYGLADGHQTWTADFGDIDNDGDLDLFKTQHDIISELYENIDNDTFINITDQSGLNIGGVPLQGMFRDFDNDGFQDILISGDHVEYYRNNGDRSFTKENPFGNVIFGTFALGDLNADGFTDIYASRVIPFNNPDPLREDILYITEPNGNHYLSLSLTDSTANTSSIGAMALLYGPWGTQIREVRGGEQYGVSNGHQMVFGLGDATTYDSLVIRWPDGTKESFNNLDIDKRWNIKKGGCRTLDLEIFPKLGILCNNDSLVLNIDSEFTTVTWSNGAIGDSLIVKESGIYFATLEYIDQCSDRTFSIEVISDPDTTSPTIQYEGHPELCNGEIALLSLSPGTAYQWSTGDTTQTIEATESGDYFALVDGYCKSQPSDTIHLDFITPDLPVTTPDTFMPGESAILIATGDSIVWYSDEFGLNQIGTGTNLVLDNLDDTTTIYAQNLLPIVGEDYQVGPINHQGNTKYNAAFVNGGELFDVYEPIVIDQITVNTDSAGMRIIEITDELGFLFQYPADLEAGSTVLHLNVTLPVGSYTIGTNTDMNNQVFGVNSPYLWRSSMGILYPYEVTDVMSITNSTFGGDFFYYFYDWKISTADKYCSSELVPVTAVLDLGTATNDPKIRNEAILIAPNPTNGHSRLSITTEGKCAIEIIGMDGSRFDAPFEFTMQENGFNLDLSSYPSGVYLVKVIQNGKLFTQKIIKL